MSMTILHDVKCALCAKESKQERVLSRAYSEDEQDIDGRQHGSIDDTLQSMVQRCPHCNYCCWDIEKLSGKAQEVVPSDAYQKQLMDDVLPKKEALKNLKMDESEYEKSIREGWLERRENHFLCYALILEADGKLASAGWYATQAAWMCDSDGLTEKAQKCRVRAVELFEKAEKIKQHCVEDEVELLLLVDLLRRSKQFEKAAKKCEAGWWKYLFNNNVRRVLAFQKKLIRENDAMPHKCAEAFVWRVI